MTDDEIAAKLAALGDTADAVALALADLGVKGVTGEPYVCPLARYCRVLGVREPEVDYTSFQGNHWTRPLPPGCRAFVQAFDDHKYPTLIDHTEDTHGR